MCPTKIGPRWSSGLKIKVVQLLYRSPLNTKVVSSNPPRDFNYKFTRITSNADEYRGSLVSLRLPPFITGHHEEVNYAGNVVKMPKNQIKPCRRKKYLFSFELSFLVCSTVMIGKNCAVVVVYSIKYDILKFKVGYTYNNSICIVRKKENKLTKDLFNTQVYVYHLDEESKSGIMSVEKRATKGNGIWPYGTQNEYLL